MRERTSVFRKWEVFEMRFYGLNDGLRLRSLVNKIYSSFAAGKLENNGFTIADHR